MDSFFGDNKDIERFNEVADMFGDQELVTVVVDASSSNHTVAANFMDDMISKLKGCGWFRDISNTHNMDFLENNLLLYIPTEQISFLNDPNITYEDKLNMIDQVTNTYHVPSYIVSENDELYLINMNINVSLLDMEMRETVFEGLYDLIDETLELDPSYDDLDVGYTGGMMVMDYEGDKMAMSDIQVTGLITMSFIIVLLFFTFRSISLPLLSVVPLIVGIIITAGIIGLVFGSLGIMSMSFAILLLGLGVDFSIHLLSRFTEEMKEHSDVSIAFKHTFIHTGKGVVMGCLTTATAFGSLYFGMTQAMKEMGVISAIGLIVTMICVFIVLPALTTLRLRFGKLEKKISKTNRSFLPLETIGRTSARYFVMVIILFLLISGFYVYKVPDAEISTNVTEMQPKTIPTYKQMEKVKDNFNYTEDFLLVVVDSFEELERQVMEFSLVEEVMDVESVLDMLPVFQDENLKVIEEAMESDPLLASSEFFHVDEMTWRDLPLEIRSSWVNEDEDQPRFLIRIKALGNIYVEDYRNELMKDLDLVNEDIIGQALLWPMLIDAMTTDVAKVSIIATIPIFFLVYIGFRKLNPVYAFLALCPVFFGILGILALHEYVGVTLNFASILTIPLVIGIGIDDGIHIIHRYLEEGKKSIPLVIKNTGKAIFLTTGTTCLAFSSFLFAEHPATRSLGRVPVLGLILCFIASIILLPALLKLIFERKEKKNADKQS
jgi:predicted RND superfamily exporter protein